MTRLDNIAFKEPTNLKSAILYLQNILTKRIDNNSSKRNGVCQGVIWLDFQESDDLFIMAIVECRADIFEFLTPLLPLVPHLNTDFFDDILNVHFPEGSQFPASGGVRGKYHRGLLPTGKTVQFVLAGIDLAKRMTVQQLKDLKLIGKHFFIESSRLFS